MMQQVIFLSILTQSLLGQFLENSSHCHCVKIGVFSLFLLKVIILYIQNLLDSMLFTFIIDFFLCQLSVADLAPM